MLSEFGKICRKIRIDHNELSKDMADKLGVTPAYLSAVELGKRNVPNGWAHKISQLYSLDKKTSEELERSAYRGHIKVFLKDDEEKKAIEERAEQEGYSAGDWLREMAIKKLRSKRKGDK